MSWHQTVLLEKQEHFRKCVAEEKKKMKKHTNGVRIGTMSIVLKIGWVFVFARIRQNVVRSGLIELSSICMDKPLRHSSAERESLVSLPSYLHLFCACVRPVRLTI